MGKGAWPQRSTKCTKLDQQPSNQGEGGWPQVLPHGHWEDEFFNRRERREHKEEPVEKLFYRRRRGKGVLPNSKNMEKAIVGG
jgi:hypothetical protein